MSDAEALDRFTTAVRGGVRIAAIGSACYLITIGAEHGWGWLILLAFLC